MTMHDPSSPRTLLNWLSRAACLVLLIVSLSGCSSYRKRTITVVDLDGNPAADRTVSFHNLAPAPLLVSINYPTGTLGAQGSATMRMPLTSGILRVDGIGASLLDPQEIENGVSMKPLSKGPRLEGFTIVLPETNWRLTVAEP